MPEYKNETGRTVTIEDQNGNLDQVPNGGTFQTLNLYSDAGFTLLSNEPWHKPAKGAVVTLLDREAIGPGQRLEPTALNLSGLEGYTSAEILVEGAAVATVTREASMDGDGFAVPEGAEAVFTSKAAGRHLSQFGADMAPFLRLPVQNTGGEGFITLKLHVR